jgi:hypothetical protein
MITGFGSVSALIQCVKHGGVTDYRWRVPKPKETSMKKLLALGFLTLSLAMSAPSFAAEHVISRPAKSVGKDSYKAARYSAKETGKATKSVVKFIL